MAMAEGTITIDPVTGAETFDPIPPLPNAAAEYYQELTDGQGLDVLFTGPTLAEVREQYANLARAHAKMVIHTVDNAEVATSVSTSVSVTSVSGVTAGGATSGPGSGSGSGSGAGTVS